MVFLALVDRIEWRTSRSLLPRFLFAYPSNSFSAHLKQTQSSFKKKKLQKFKKKPVSHVVYAELTLVDFLSDEVWTAHDAAFR